MPSEFEVLNSTVWYIRCEDTGFPKGGAVSEGSGVTIRLCGGSIGEYARNYLLTCAHVIRKAAPAAELGPRYAEIRAWPPGSGYNPAGGFVLEPVTDALPIPSIAGDNFYEEPVPDVPGSDWALLAFADAAKSNDSGLSWAKEWDEANPERGTACYIIGYPGGAAGFEGHDHAKNDTVRPSLPYGRQLVAAAGNGVIEFQGSHSRVGMSGGGVFVAESKTFVGLHRERNDLIQQLHAVSSAQIKRVLNDCGYRVAARDEDGDNGGGAPRAIDLNDLSLDDVLAIATTLLKTAITDCRDGCRIELRVGPRRKLAITVSAFAADSMNRLALKGALDLFHVQQTSLKDLQTREELGMWPGAAFGIEIERKRTASEETVKDIRASLGLMIEDCIQLN